ncbi:hypothetical protein [Lewinella sp. W8]|uniref:hypothetical protein n=1 Tax=Lewinella sp. W8 TaxID=2528208 RepID=UPI0010674398|nr:hypothetical protein [Lewinella sp. W8]MTB49783.1 hypothetical protein [Lewinella sp. W8]
MLFRLLMALLVGLLPFAGATAQVELTAGEWRADLDFFQKTIHTDYPFLFKKTTVAAFDEQVEQLREAIPEMAAHEIKAGFIRLVSSFAYGHTSIRPLSEEVGFHRLPLNLYEFSDGLFVEGASRDYSRAVGARVINIEGRPVAEALTMVRPMIPAENDYFVKAYGLYMLCIPEILHASGVTEELKKEITFTLEKDGETFEQQVVAEQSPEISIAYGFSKSGEGWTGMRDETVTPHYLDSLEKHYYFRYLPEERVVYVRYSQVFPDPTESIDDFFKRVFAFVDANEVERLVLDVRLNGGGNNFNNKYVVTNVIRADKINQPGKFFVLIGRRTFSACQNLVNELDNYTNAIFLGEPTGENVNFYGDNRLLVLPNSKIPVRLSWAWWQDKPQWQNADWLAPHLAVGLSAEEYRTNQDPVLAKALQFDGDNFVRDPMQHLTDLFSTGKIMQVQTDAQKFVEDPNYRFVDFEGEFDRIGQMLLGGGRNVEASFVLRMNNRLFPESARTHYRYGIAVASSGKTDQAKELFAKAIALDGDGAIAAAAREEMAKLQ